MADVKFYRQKTTGAIFTVVAEGPEGHEVCDNWEEIVAGSVDAAAEKHVPAVTVEDGKVCVRVGEVAHPMLDAHYIEWIALADGAKLAFKYLKPGDEPEAFFAGEHGTIYAYCNLHGLWKAEF